MGIGALVVGILAFILALIPCIGMFFAVPLGVVGLILAVVGAIIAFTRQGAGIGFPIAGAAINLVAIVVAIGWFYGSSYLVKKGAEKPQKGITDAVDNIENDVAADGDGQSAAQHGVDQRQRGG